MVHEPTDRGGSAAPPTSWSAPSRRSGPQGLAVAGRRCLDAGASTGGFTDVLLRRGAARWSRVDVGYGQLAWPRAHDDRGSTVHSGTNVRGLTRRRPRRPGRPRRRRPVVHLAHPGARRPRRAAAPRRRPRRAGQAAVRGRPRAARTRRGGRATRATAPAPSREVAAAARERGPGACAASCPSPLRGPAGNVEYFLWLRSAPSDRMSADRVGDAVRATARIAAEDRDDDHGRAPHPARHPRAPAGGPASSPPTSSTRLIAAGIERLRAAERRRTPLGLRRRRRGVVDGATPDGRRRRRGLRAGLRARRRRHDPARRRAARDSGAPAARRQPRPRRLPRRGRARGPRRHRRAHRRARLHRRGADDPRRARLRRTATGVRRRWALNEATVEKAARERMLEVVVEIDGRPLSRWGCDGVVWPPPPAPPPTPSPPGGPVVWPDVEALLLVPISAHALFARPLVVGPQLPPRRRGRSPARQGAGVLWCDGRRAVDLPPGARIEVHALASSRCGWPGCDTAAVHRPAGRQVRPPGRRAGGARPAPSRRADGRPMDRLGAVHRRRSASATSASSTRPCWSCTPGLTVVTGETGAGKTMVVTGLGLLLGGRGRRRLVRAGADRAASRASSTSPAGHPRARAGRRGRRRGRATGWSSCRTVSAEGRSRAPSAAAPPRSACSPSSPSTSSPCTARPTSSGCASADQQREVARPLRRRRRRRRRCAAYRRPARRARAGRGRARATCARRPRERAREADLLRFGLEQIEAVDPQPGEDVELRVEAERLGHADDLRGRRRAPPTRRSPATTTAGRRSPRRARALAAASSRRRGGAATTTRPWPARPTGSPSCGYLPPTSPPTWRPTSPTSSRPGPAGRVEQRRAALGADPQVRRRPSTSAGLGAASAAARLAELDGTDDRIGELDARLRRR